MILYGTKPEPIKLSKGEVITPQVVGSTAGWLAASIGSALAFIFLSLIPIAGPGLAAAEETIAASVETAEVVSAAVEATATEVAEIDVTSAIDATASATAAETANTATTVALGNTIKGTVGLGVAEFGVNRGIEYGETGEVNPLGSILDLLAIGLGVRGVIGLQNATKIRTLKLVDQQIKTQEKILAEATDAEVRANAIRRLDQLKQTRIVRQGGVLSYEVESQTTLAAQRELDKIVNGSTSMTERQAAKQLRESLGQQEIKLTKQETREFVAQSAKNYDNLEKGMSLSRALNSQYYRRWINITSNLDPNLFLRKRLQTLVHNLTDDEKGIFETRGLWSNKKYFKNFGRKVNIGVYKKYGKKLNKLWEKKGKKFYKATAARMKPVASQWIAGYRTYLINEFAQEYALTIIFHQSKSGRIPAPVTISPVSLEAIIAFTTAPSKGAHYLDYYALARNGAATIAGSLGGLGFGIGLGRLRHMLQGVASAERLIKDFTQKNYWKEWEDALIETPARLGPHKVGKIAAGRWGIALARGFQRTSGGHTIMTSQFDPRHLMEEVKVVTLDRARSVQRAAGVQGRTKIIGAQRTIGQYQRMIKLVTFGAYKFDAKHGIKKGNNPLLG